MPVSLADLPDHLSRPARRYHVAVPGPLAYVDTAPDAYVPPPVSYDTDIEHPAAAILLVSAPAATGKSAAAAYLASVTGAPIVDLAKLQVGSSTLSGTVSDSLGALPGAAFLTELAAGDQLLILDALDEAELRAGERNFQDFLNGLERYGRVAGAKPTILILGRTETIDWVALTFETDAVPYNRLSIDFFDLEQAREFLDRRLDSLYAADGDGPLHRTHRHAFTAVRDLLLQHVYVLYEAADDSAWSNPDLRRFLGYAPVLEAIARYLKVPNHYALEQKLRHDRVSAAPQDQWELLRHVVEDLLVREQEKFANSVWDQLVRLFSESWSGKSAVYSPEEQCERLVARIDGAPPPQLPLGLPPEARATYEAACASSLLNHPFLSGPAEFVSVVFRDYIYARALTLVVQDAVTVERVRRLLRADDYLATPLLAGFLHALTQQPDPSGDRVGMVSSRDVAAVIDSLRSRETKNDRYLTVLVGNRQGAALIVGRLRPPGGFDGFIRTGFVVTTPEDGILLPTRISNLIATFAGTLELGSRGGDLVLGPDVHIAGKEVIALANDITVHASEERGDVEVRATSFLGAASASITKYGNGWFRVSWPEMTHPWLPHGEVSFTFAGAARAHRVHAELRRIVTRFRDKHDHWVQVYQPLLDNLVITRNVPAQSVLKALQAMDLVTLSGDFYVLDLRELGARGVNYVDLRSNRDTPAIRSLVLEIANLIGNDPWPD